MTDLIRLKTAEQQLQSLTAGSDRETLIQSLRMLALYVATYKAEHGELRPEQIELYLQAQDTDPDTLQILEGGLQEAIAMLSMVRALRQPAAAAETALLN